ncbi:MAG: hypothetical protein NTW86_21195 [Candidatus Sumerlaeota bacterium]|nr:hypothetical protein [Candidatus Sumerlaeota bacterium]
MNDEVLKAARRLARQTPKGESSVQEILWFPAEDEIRILEVDAEAVPTDRRVAPFYFDPDVKKGGIRWLAVAGIRPEEKGRGHLPKGWGAWENAVSLWRREAARSSTKRRSGMPRRREK